MDGKSEPQKQEAKMCVQCKQFWGSPANKDMCSKCFKYSSHYAAISGKKKVKPSPSQALKRRKRKNNQNNPKKEPAKAFSKTKQGVLIAKRK